jgi:hypothetical protein
VPSRVVVVVVGAGIPGRYPPGGAGSGSTGADVVVVAGALVVVVVGALVVVVVEAFVDVVVAGAVEVVLVAAPVVLAVEMSEPTVVVEDGRSAPTTTLAR